MPAIFAGVKRIFQSGNHNILIMPSDQVINDETEFTNIIMKSVELSKDYILTFGVTPIYPNTNYGYISVKENILNGFLVDEFKEKPNIENAKTYIKKGYYWNAGIFMFNIKIFFEEVFKHSKEIYKAFDENETIENAYKKIKEKVSIDKGLLEKTSKIALVPIDVGWDDLGSYNSLFNYLKKDENLNNINTNNIILESKGNFVYSDDEKMISLIGINDTVVIDNKDTLFISKKEEAHKVNEITKILKKNNDDILKYHVQDYRPWGYYVVLDEVESVYKVKKIHVYQGKKLSLQSHKYRSEHWIVITGVAKVTIGDTQKVVKTGESIFISSGQKHRLENETNDILEIIEVQTGVYLGEDDITRYEDDFGRK